MTKKVELPFVRSAYNYDRDAVSDETGLRCLDASRTKQSFKDEVDINTLVRRFGVTGEFPVGVRAPTYGDFSQVIDFHSAMNAVAKAHEAFDQMPAEVRARFNNDPGAFVDFCSDDKNRDEAVKLGLVVPPPPGPSPDTGLDPDAVVEALKPSKGDSGKT